MNSKYPILPPKKIIKVMKRLGFHKISQKGSHAKFINQNAYYAPGILPGGWQGHEGGFTLFYKTPNIIILVFIGQYDIHLANYTIESDTISNVLKVTTTEL